ncbi:hypothetical protein [Photobacterium chitinilyticum]|uniref:Uncharacterized protein n=1 Tax=Photobacterium chitinilyticum TaxID=2485123 RepID=A0A444JIF1_9GAMM|nr:hypothetical protein [Photobacterium chitinilyticum]RWX52846.1 hypothetical protein EDI28_24980 [Photobacterium chitinilyticum]
MIGWKIVCCFWDETKTEEVEVVCEVVGYPNFEDGRVWVPVYHGKVIKMAEFTIDADIKVIERR